MIKKRHVSHVRYYFIACDSPLNQNASCHTSKILDHTKLTTYTYLFDLPYGPSNAADHSSYAFVHDTDGCRHLLISRACQAEGIQGEDGSGLAVEAYTIAVAGLTGIEQ